MKAEDRSPRDIMRISRSFTESRILLTGVELDIFNLLKPEPLSAAEITTRLNSDLRATTIILDALAAGGYLEKKEGLYRTEPSVSPFITDGSPDTILPGLRHAAQLWPTWSQLTDVVLQGGPANKGECDREDHTTSFIGAMHVTAYREAPKIIEAISPVRSRALIDVGGASGSFTIAFLEKYHGMRATIFDLPEVIELARERVGEAGLLDRISLVPGDYHKDELPPGHDLALLSAVIHQNSREENVKLYKKVFRSLDPGGRIIVRDYVMGPDRTEPPSGSVFAVNMLVNTRGGNSYTFQEIRDGLAEAGFEKIRSLEMREMSSLVEAFKP
jgi:ubiquinone/menaquinone biosynthesis C-methylase UbiE